MHGILVASILDDYADITLALYDIKDNITAITILGSQLLGERLSVSLQHNNYSNHPTFPSQLDGHKKPHQLRL